MTEIGKGPAFFRARDQEQPCLYNHIYGITLWFDARSDLDVGESGSIRLLSDTAAIDTLVCGSKRRFWPKGIAAKAVFGKYPGKEMKTPNYSDKAKARARDPGLFTNHG
ncbi:hypothetical protein E4U35_002410 [Claviceps purpurea]|nr:hypothetical protein E4U28_005719 [Claviceps purpurea]KAG6192282.1 hypothetical protein E4U27_003440 [Claviceps purpurea]KAG6205709.1 hypothetical protein E4U35_002410 [Claviceps purpurea]KAG6222018.1 hypothetical protein E4U26_005591 [Claviceps purpurea]